MDIPAKGGSGGRGGGEVGGSRSKSILVALSESTINRLSAENGPFFLGRSREHLLDLDI